MEGGREKPPAAGASSLPSRVPRGGRTPAPLTQRMRLSQSSGSADFASMAAAAAAFPPPSSKPPSGRPRSGGSGRCSAPPARPAGAGPPPALTTQRPPLPSAAGSDSASGQSQRRRGALAPITVRPVGGGGCPHGCTASVRGRVGLASPAPGCVIRPGLACGRKAMVSPSPGWRVGERRSCHPPGVNSCAESGPAFPRSAWEEPLRPNMAGAASSLPAPAVRQPGRGGHG